MQFRTPIKNLFQTMSEVFSGLKNVCKIGVRSFGGRPINRFLGLILASLVLASCGLAPGQQIQLNGTLPPPVQGAKIHLFRIDKSLERHQAYLVSPSAYRIGPEDVLNIVVWDHPELTIPAGGYRTPEQSGIEIAQDGTIYYPFVGKVYVSGMTAEHLRSMLSKRLAKYIRDPQVSVRVAAFNSKKIQVMGEVMKPATEPLTNVPLSLMTAVNKAGGLNPATADANKIFVIRAIHHKTAVFVLDANNPSDLLIAEHFYLKNHDVVFVAPAGLATWNRVISNIVPAVQTGYYLDLVANR